MTADHSYSLEALQRRWQSEKTPQVGLRLAEEYRRKGDLKASIEALTAGLEVYPTHIASRVALSRYLVDGESFEEAVPHLEQIVALDPTHLVANKLLVGAYAGIGRLDEASDKLDIYEMMAEGDADIERLRELLSAERRKRSAPQAGAGAVAAVPPVAPLAAVAPVPPVAEIAEVAEVADAVDIEASSDGAVVAATIPEERATLGFEPAPAAEPVPAAAAEVEAEPEPARVSAAPAAPAAPASRESQGATALDDPFTPTVEEEPFGPAIEVDSISDYWREVADEGIFALAPTAGESEPVAEVEPEPVEPAVSEAPASASSLAPQPENRAVDSTVTLGRLYLEQGHREEAAEVFEDVLTREPDNEVAQRELESSRVPEAAVSGGTDDEERASAVDILERKRSALTAYLTQIRRAVAAGI